MLLRHQRVTEVGVGVGVKRVSFQRFAIKLDRVIEFALDGVDICDPVITGRGILIEFDRDLKTAQRFVVISLLSRLPADVNRVRCELFHFRLGQNALLTATESGQPKYPDQNRRETHEIIIQRKLEQSNN